MKRREFSVGLGMTAMAVSARVSAQGGPVEGQHYVRLSQPLPQAAAGKIDLVEFFWYGCPHCNALEPLLDPWFERQPADVNARRMPVGFSPTHETHQKIFFTLEAMGVLPTMHRKVFAAIHTERKRLDKEPEILAFMTANGVDAVKFGDLFKSFTVITKAKQAKQLSEAYRIDGVPALGVAGRYYTSSAMAGGHQRAMAAADYLIALSRKG